MSASFPFFCWADLAPQKSQSRIQEGITSVALEAAVERKSFRRLVGKASKHFRKSQSFNAQIRKCCWRLSVVDETFERSRSTRAKASRGKRNNFRSASL